MRHGRIQMFSAACGLAVSLTALAAEPPSTNDEAATEQSQTQVQAETGAETRTAESAESMNPEPCDKTRAEGCASADCGCAGCDGAGCEGAGCEAAGCEGACCLKAASGTEQAADKNCWDSRTWGEGESKDTRCNRAGFLLGEQAFEDGEGFAPGFFTNRPDPMAIRPMYSEELLFRFDADKDGSLSGQERTTTEVFLEARRSAHKSSLTYRFDFDGSEDLSAAEKLEARRVLFLEQTEALNVLVERFDADRDGVLDERECMTARLTDAEAFYEVEFHEGVSHSFAYREGPGLPSERAEAFEEASESLKAEAKADQAEILRTVVVGEEHASDNQTATAGETPAAGQEDAGVTETVAEVETGDEPG